MPKAFLRSPDGPEQLPRGNGRGEHPPDLPGGLLVPDLVAGQGHVCHLDLGHLLYVPRHILYTASRHNSGQSGDQSCAQLQKIQLACSIVCSITYFRVHKSLNKEVLAFLNLATSPAVLWTPSCNINLQYNVNKFIQ